jgi:hypothetical protein
MGTPDSSARVLWKSYKQSHIVARQEELAKEMNFASPSISVILRRDL